MAKIKCVRCKKDSSYTDATPVSSRTRSFIADGGDERHRVHLCSPCWEHHSGDKAMELVS